MNTVQKKLDNNKTNFFLRTNMKSPPKAYLSLLTKNLLLLTIFLIFWCFLVLYLGGLWCDTRNFSSPGIMIYVSLNV